MRVMTIATLSAGTNSYTIGHYPILLLCLVRISREGNSHDIISIIGCSLSILLYTHSC